MHRNQKRIAYNTYPFQGKFLLKKDNYTLKAAFCRDVKINLQF